MTEEEVHPAISARVNCFSLSIRIQLGPFFSCPEPPCLCRISLLQQKKNSLRCFAVRRCSLRRKKTPPRVCIVVLEPHPDAMLTMPTVSQQKRIKRKHDESMSADSPSSRNPKIQRSNSAAPTEGFQMNAEVAYRLPKQKGAEYEWIQCTITGILGDGIKRKYVLPVLLPCCALGGLMTF